MTERYLVVAGQPARRVTLHVPGIGPWWADVEFEGAPAVSGRVNVVVGELELSGTIDPNHDGTHGLSRRCRVVAGAGGWATLLAARAYHNDAGVRARIVADEAAAESGESIDGFSPAAERVGPDYVRQAGPAARVLEDVLAGAAWWVDYEGRTQVGTRATSEPAADAYAVLEHDPADRLVLLDVDDLRAIRIGSRLTGGLDAPRVVRELELDVCADTLRLAAWCVADGEEIGRGRLAGLLRSLVARATDGRLHGVFKYRVVRMSVDRVELQVVSSRAGLPSILPISVWPGVPGASAQITPGAIALVQFVEGDRAQPIVTHFEGKDASGFLPISVDLDAVSTVSLAGGILPIARQTDPVTAGPYAGTIQAGAPKARA